MLVSIPNSYEDHHNADDVQVYSQTMSKHHHSQYQRVQDYPPAPQKMFEDQMQMPIHQDYYYDAPVAPNYVPPPNYDFQFNPEYVPATFEYMHQNTSASQFSHSSSLSSPRLEHQHSHTSLPGSLPSPYSKDHADMLAAMRNRTHSWSSRSSRKSRAFSYDSKWNMPYEPQVGLAFGSVSGDSDQLVSPLVGSVDEQYGGDAAAAAAAAAAAGERMRANSHPPYLYSPSAGPTALPVPAPPSMQQPATASPQHPRLERNSSYGSNGSDNECYSPTYGQDDADDRRSKKSATCPICNKVLKRDLTRHMRTHEEVARFICPFPRSQCPHKRGQFNRPYDFKKHLLHHHFQFDKAKVVRRFRDLHSKLTCRGSCPCGQGNFTAAEWLDNHILGGQVCPLVQAQDPNSNDN